jgi:HPt (histidine-containing phosphotransfer) domain-containing protein
MSGLTAVVESYVASMRPKGEAFVAALDAWVAASESETAGIVADVHKFAGSAGSAGFARLSAVATLLEIGLRALGSPRDPLDVALLEALGGDFAAEIAALAPAASSLVSGEERTPYTPFTRPARVILAGLPPASAAILGHVIEQRMGMAFPMPDAAMLADVPAGRAPDLAVVARPTAAGFPVVVLTPAGLDGITANWPLN